MVVPLHLVACIALVIAAIYWKTRDQIAGSIYRKMLPFIGAAGFLGLVMLYQYLLEMFVSSYSGSIYEGNGPNPGSNTWVVISVAITLLPLVGLIPAIGRRLDLLIEIGCWAALPSAWSILSAS